MFPNFIKYLLLLAIPLSHCTQKSTSVASTDTHTAISRDLPAFSKGKDTTGLETATLAGGCFWKMDACYQQLKGIKKLAVGYGGGTMLNPTYTQVGTQKTGHAESIQLMFDPSVISYREILEIFWSLHDPTQFDREGNDVGNDYRSAVFYHTETQLKIAEKVRDSLDQSGMFKSAIVTEITPFSNFYKAEEYHQDYYNEHPWEPYNLSVVRPKVKHFEEVFSGKMK